MLDAGRVERLLTWTRPRYVLPLVADKGTYTWGLVAGETTPADIPPQPRCAWRYACSILVAAPAQEWPIQILTQEEYEHGVWFKDLRVRTSSASTWRIRSPTTCCTSILSRLRCSP